MKNLRLYTSSHDIVCFSDHPVIKRLLVWGWPTAELYCEARDQLLKYCWHEAGGLLHDLWRFMESMAHKMRLYRRAIKIWVLYLDMDVRLKNPYAIKVVCGFRSTTRHFLIAYDCVSLLPRCVCLYHRYVCLLISPHICVIIDYATIYVIYTLKYLSNQSFARHRHRHNNIKWGLHSIDNFSQHWGNINVIFHEECMEICNEKIHW